MHLLIRSIFLVLSLLSVAMVNSQDIQLVDYYMSECSGFSREIERIAEITQKESNLTEIVFSAEGNCVMLDSIDVSQSSDSIFFTYDYREQRFDYETLYIEIEDSETGKVIGTEIYRIDTIPYTVSAWCNCCFTFNLTLSGYDQSKNYTFIGNGKEVSITEHRFPLKPISFEIFESDTINYRDLYGFMQGRWILKNDKGLITEDAIYENGSIVNGKTDKKYDYGKRLISEREEILIETEEGYRRVYSELFYYPSGNLKRKCIGLFPQECEDFPDEPIE